jgi:hypothetical protein
MTDGIRVFLLAGSGPSMEDEEDGLVLFRVGLPLHVRLVLTEKFRVQFDVARLVDTMDVSEACGDREVRANLRQRGPDVIDVFGLCVEGVVVDVFVVDAVLLTASDSNFL